MVFGVGQFNGIIYIDPRCHGNEIWDKVGHNLAPLKHNCMLFAPTPYFRARAIWWCHLNFSPGDPCCHGNEIWDKIDYNSVCVRDICKIFAPIWGLSKMSHRMLPTEFFPERPLFSLPWQQNLGHSGLDLGLRKRCIKDLCVRWGVFKISLFWYWQCAIIRKHTYAPTQKSYVKYTTNHSYLPTKNISTFSSSAIIN